MHYYLDIPNPRFHFMRIACTKGAYYRVLPDSCPEKKRERRKESHHPPPETPVTRRRHWWEVICGG
jgi:hypothetical protein